MDLVQAVANKQLKKNLPHFRVGDTVDVHVKIVEGDKERTQVFRGTVIADNGRGVNRTFTVRRVVQGQGVERVFPLHSPMVMKVEVKAHGKVRRAKLYYLRDRVGRAIKVKPTSAEEQLKRRAQAKKAAEETVHEAENE